MKVVGLNCSPNKDGNTFTAINKVFQPIKEEGIETEIIQVSERPIYGCRSCYTCVNTGEGFCIMDSDIFNDCLKKMYEADGIIIGSPVYFGSVSTQAKALIDRAGLCAINGGYLLKRKVCAGVLAARRQGAVTALNQINNLFLLNQSIIPCSIYWNMGIGLQKGEIEDDSEGLDTFKVLGENMAWLIKKINS